jgi:CheY-like chemotaxis protein
MSSPLSSPARGGTVLVVDDEAMLRQLLSRTLSEAGYEVVEAENGETALRAVSGCRASLILVVTDISMPVMSGIEFAREFRPLYPRVPILFITGREADSRPGPGLAQDDLLLKPFGPDDFLDAVSRILTRDNHEGRFSA